MAEQHQEQQNQPKREAQVDTYLRSFVFPYLLELASAPPRRIDFQGELFQYSQIIRAAIKGKLLEDPCLNNFTARQRVRELVDGWITNLLSERSREELQKRTLEVQRLSLELEQRQLQHDLQQLAEDDAKIKRKPVRDGSPLNKFARAVIGMFLR